LFIDAHILIEIFKAQMEEDTSSIGSTFTTALTEFDGLIKEVFESQQRLSSQLDVLSEELTKFKDQYEDAPQLSSKLTQLSDAKGRVHCVRLCSNSSSFSPLLYRTHDQSKCYAHQD